MNVNFKTGLLLSLLKVMTLSFIINCQHETSLQPELSCIDDQPVLDTTYVYLSPLTKDTLLIAPEFLFVRFQPWLTDTSRISQLLKKHKLEPINPLSSIDQQIIAELCITDNRRSEYYFTPYGKEDFCNFGADSLVEYAFAVFFDGFVVYTGALIFQFEDSVSQVEIDSLFETNGLRLLRTTPNFPTGTLYRTLITPKSPKNILELASELQSIPYINHVIAEVPSRMKGLRCE